MRSLLRAITVPVVVAIAGTSAARAADMPVKAPIREPAAVAVYNWGGFYVGANVGGAWLDKSVTETGTTNFIANPIGSSFSLDDGSITAGGQAGFNWHRNNLLVGVEADVNWTGIRHTVPANIPPGTGAILRGDVDWFATFRGRLGYAPGNWLIYVTGGAAVARLINEYGTEVGGVLAVNSNDAVSSRRTRSGWTAGGGIELGLAANWSVKAEYLFLDFRRFEVKPIAGTPGGAATFKDELHVARVGLNYRFGGPVVARY
jgi:outer membrane immunogenic protein